jgi:hypothetical protein
MGVWVVVVVAVVVGETAVAGSVTGVVGETAAAGWLEAVGGNAGVVVAAVVWLRQAVNRRVNRMRTSRFFTVFMKLSSKM